MPIGMYLTGQLTLIERTHLNLACERWLHGDFTVPNYLIRLSDIVRGPVVEGSSWFPMDEAIRLEPSHSDLVRIPSESNSVSSSARFLVNPYTSCYLAGSASLPSFAAYLMRQKLKTDTPLPLRLVSLGTLYDRKTSPTNTVRRTAVGLHTPRFVQRKQLSVMELSSSWHSCESGFHQLVDDVCRFWANYQPTWPLRLVYVSAKALAPCEMIRAVVELIPNDNDDATQNGRICPIQLASVSLLDDWVSRRVLAKVDRMATDGDQVSSYVRMNYVQVIDFNSLLSAFRQTGTLTVSSL
ncbi:hypothetical protein PHET_01577 [Paragonimus heterotremus]|uniref:Uncharacterized protein n=1 Tax=Paragonimus heterotremus TaxID=100268 RepID=A0A8J4WUK8_9TREM|nr:hypothetical protein PHET_01577 [Paragonimus heterotremus]